MVPQPLQSSSQGAACYYQFNRSKGNTIPLSALQNDIKRNYWLDLHTIYLMLNVKQGSCEYQLFKVFFGYGSTRELNPSLPIMRWTL